MTFQPNAYHHPLSARCGHDHASSPCPPLDHHRKGPPVTRHLTHVALTLTALLAVALVAFGALAKACRDIELGEKW